MILVPIKCFYCGDYLVYNVVVQYVGISTTAILKAIQ